MEITLSKNGWYCKLQRWVFKDPPLYNSLCPMFWFTIFCIIFTFIIPVVPFIKLLVLIFKGSQKLLIWINDNICIPMMNSIIQGMDDSQLLKSWVSYTDDYNSYHYYGDMTPEQQKDWDFWRNDAIRMSDVGYSSRERSSNRFKKWQSLNPDWREKIEAIKEKRKAEYEKKVQDSILSAHEAVKRLAAKREQRWKNEEIVRLRKITLSQAAEKSKKRRQKMFTNIAIYTKWIAYVIVAALVSLMGYGLYKGIVWLGVHIPWARVGHVTLILLISIIATVVILSIIYLIVKLVQKCQIRPSESKFLKGCAVPFIWIWKFMVWFFMSLILPVCEFIYKWMILPCGGAVVGIGYGFKFLGMYLKSTKDGYCPHINFIEDDEKK